MQRKLIHDCFVKPVKLTPQPINGTPKLPQEDILESLQAWYYHKPLSSAAEGGLFEAKCEKPHFYPV